MADRAPIRSGNNHPNPSIILKAPAGHAHPPQGYARPQMPSNQFTTNNPFPGGAPFTELAANQQYQQSDHGRRMHSLRQTVDNRLGQLPHPAHADQDPLTKTKDPEISALLPYYGYTGPNGAAIYYPEINLWLDALPKIRSEILEGARIVIRMLNPVSHSPDKHRSYDIVTLFDDSPGHNYNWRCCIVSEDVIFVQGDVAPHQFQALSELQWLVQKTLGQVLPKAWMEAGEDEDNPNGPRWATELKNE